jgi:hypothetical protein
MCTSIAPAARITLVPIPGPVSAALIQDRRLSPITSWLAFCPRAKLTRVSVTSSPTSWWNVPPSCSVSADCAASEPGSASRRPVCADTCTASSSPPADLAAIRAPRRSRVSPSGPPVRATTTRSRASQGASIACSLR